VALARCKVCGCPPNTKRSYPHRHGQLPSSGELLLCASSACVRVAEIWLTDAEQSEYDDGTRSFRVHKSRDVVVV